MGRAFYRHGHGEGSKSRVDAEYYVQGFEPGWPAHQVQQGNLPAGYQGGTHHNSHNTRLLGTEQQKEQKGGSKRTGGKLGNSSFAGASRKIEEQKRRLDEELKNNIAQLLQGNLVSPCRKIIGV